MNLRSIFVVSILVLAIPQSSWCDETKETAPETSFTGEILTLLYVKDVQKSVRFYMALGFRHDYFYDYQDDGYRLEWEQPYPPEYAEMKSENIRIGLTTAEEPDQVYGGGVRHYFIVDDVNSHYALAKQNGIVADPDEVEERPWMNFFTVLDPDEHLIVFGQKNQAYYDRARQEIEALTQR